MIREEIQQGWQCPVCKRVMAPWVKECDGVHYEVRSTDKLIYNPGLTCGTNLVGYWITEKELE
jgi:hypothetical protein